MVKKVKARKDRNKTAMDSLPSTTTIQSLPDDLLERIAEILQAEHQFGSLAALDRTSKRVSGVCKKVLWQDVTLKRPAQLKGMMKPKSRYLREMVQYLQVESHRLNWFWNDLKELTFGGITQDYMIHSAFPSIKSVVERFKISDTKVPGANINDSARTSDWKIGISISIRNHLDDNAVTSRTMEKVLQAVLRLSGRTDETLAEYVDGIISIPNVMTRSVAGLEPITRQSYLEYCEKVCAQSAMISSYPRPLVQRIFGDAYDAFRSGEWEHISAAGKSHILGLIHQMGTTSGHTGLLMDLEGLGSIPIHLLTNISSPNPRHDLVTVTYRLFMQMVAIFSTPTNLKCHGPMELRLLCHTFAIAEEWCDTLLRNHDTNDVEQDRFPPSSIKVELLEKLSPADLLNNVWTRIQQRIIVHYQPLHAKSTTYLPQSVAISARHDDKTGTTSIVEIDLSTTESRRKTEVVISNQYGEDVSVRMYQDGQLVKSVGQR